MRMPLSSDRAAIYELLRENSRDEAAYQQLCALFESTTHGQHSLATPDTHADFFAFAPELWVIGDQNGHFIDVSQMWEKTIGFSVEELRGIDFFSLLHPDDVAMTRDAMVTLGAQKLLTNFTNRYRCKDGSYRHLRWRANPRGEWIYASARDVTELVATQNALEQTNARNQATIASMSEGLVMQDSSGAIQTCNAAAERILGLSAAQMTGLKSIDPRWRAIHEDGSPFPGETHPAPTAQRTGKPVENVVMGVHKPDGALTWILINSQPLCTPTSEIPYATITTFTDITQIREAERQALDLAIERERVQVLQSFINDTSHELRTPLAVISLGIYMLAHTDEAHKRITKAAQLEDQVQYLNGLIAQLHELAELDTMPHLDVQAVALNTLTERIVNDYMEEHFNVSIQCLHDPGAEGALIKANVRQMTNAIVQLLDNAVRHSPDRSVILVRTGVDDYEATIRVIDMGVGIAREHHERIFEHFYKVDKARTRGNGGAGMGLAFVRRIMQLHGGSVTVASTPGTGAVFTLHLPI